MKLIALSIIAVFALACSSKGKNSTVKKNQDTAQKVESKMTADNSEKNINCMLAKDERKIEILKSDKGCEVLYTKGGEKKSLANSSHGISYCEKVAKNIQANLESAGFSCN